MGIPLTCWVRGQLTVWRYRRTARGAKTAVMAADQARASATWPVTVWPGGRAPWPRSRPRRALVVAVTGWLAANACSHPGMVWVGTNIELVDASGNAPVKLAAWTASGVRTTSPRAAMAHDQAWPNPRAIATPASRRHGQGAVAVDDAGGEVFGHPEGGALAAEQGELGEQPGEEPVDVAAVGGR